MTNNQLIYTTTIPTEIYIFLPYDIYEVLLTENQLLIQ